MILQKVLFPKQNICSQENLYYRSNHAIMDYEYRQLLLKREDTVIFDTWFNGFSVKKWEKYTNARNYKLHITIKGWVRICLIGKLLNGDAIGERILSSRTIECAKLTSIIMEFPPTEDIDMLTFSVTALSENAVFHGGYYSGESEKNNEINFAINICTYRREYHIRKNITELQKNVFDNKDSVLHGHLYLYIADNGNSLDCENLSSHFIKIHPNKNLGGVGGFTRNLLEILEDKTKYRITHNVFMDDDIVFDVDIFERLYLFLSVIKEDFFHATVGSTMLRIDFPAIQHETGACWNGGNFLMRKHNRDISTLENVLRNDIEEYTEYNGWWFCCMPMTLINETNLPLPIFIHRDDVEYGLRNCKKIIHLNGICVWHEYFDNKYATSMEYYDTRNSLITNAIYCPWYSKRHLQKFILRRTLSNALRYRFKINDLMFKAVRDYLAGVEWLECCDATTLHKTISSMGYPQKDVDELNYPFDLDQYDQNRYYSETKIKRYIRRLSFNGMFFRPNKDTIVPIFEPTIYSFYRANRVLNYNAITHQGFVTSKSWKEFIKNITDCCKLLFSIEYGFDKARNDYRENIHRLTNSTFWRKYLNID